MLNEDLKLKLTGILPIIQFEEGGEWLNIIVAPEELKPFVQTTPVTNPDL